jgi:hypothetical protein
MCSDSYTLRLSNVANTDNGDLVRLSANKDEYTVRIPNDLRAKGKCKLSVNSVHIQTKNGTGTDIIPNNSHTALIVADGLNLLGYNNESGNNNVLCEMAIDSNKNDIRLDGVSSPTFTCPELPAEITIKKRVYDPASPFLPIPMDAFTTDVVPCIVVLQLQFYEDMKD